MPVIRLLMSGLGWRLVLAALGVGVAGAGGAALPLAMVNQLMVHADRGSKELAIFAAAGTGIVLARLFASFALMRLSERFAHQTRVRLAEGILKTPLLELEGYGMGRLLAVTIEYFPALDRAAAVLPQVFMSIAVMVVSFGYLAWLSPITAGALVLYCLLTVGLTRLLVQRADMARQKSRALKDRLYGFLEDVILGIKELKLHRPRREELQSQRIGDVAQKLREATVQAQTKGSLIEVFTEGAFYLFLGAVLFAPILSPAGDHPTSPGALTAVFFILAPAANLTSALAHLSEANVAVTRLAKLWTTVRREVDSDPPVQASRPDADLAPPFASLELRNVSFRYHPADQKGPPAFGVGSLSLKLVPGELVFITGGNGSGKTTFAKLLTGLYAPDSGEVRVNGRLVRGASIERQRELFSSVFVDFYLFKELYGLKPETAHDAINDLLKTLKLSHKVKVEQGAFETIELSRGQRKRLAFLVSRLENRPLFLFDEWAADQEPAFKEVFYRDLLPELRRMGKAVVVITHDERYFHVADRVLKLEHGLARELPAF